MYLMHGQNLREADDERMASSTNLKGTAQLKQELYKTSRKMKKGYLRFIPPFATIGYIYLFKCKRYSK
jgi:hypothetical protein